MPGARTRVKPASANELSASDEALHLELQLQKQLEEDVARIFDESIYSDLEVACGKLKILTHSCILKARTNQFYNKLETILHVNIGRNIFDEIYSFISDAYTECNIINQEKEIITYLDNNLTIFKPLSNNSSSKRENTDESEEFLTPKCISPYKEKGFQKSISSSPSTELTKEYYALVPIESNLLEKELIEQDALSNAFQSIIKTQSENLNKIKISQRNKPTSLSLSSSHISKTVKHSNSCDILIKCHLKDNVSSKIERNSDNKVNLNTSHNKEPIQKIDIDNSTNNKWKNSTNSELITEKVPDSAYSPDSLITDDPSSSSDYLSAAYTCSPGIGSSGYFPQLNVGDNITKMENIFTSSDSGLENTGLLESLNSHKDITLTDVSLTESTLHDFITDDANNSHDSASSPFSDNNQFQRFKLSTSTHTVSLSGTSSEKDFNGQKVNQVIKFKAIANCKPSKEEKQRQNEEIVILESSSLSSETGSWESVFPPKLAEKEICEKFIRNERQFSNTGDVKNEKKDPSSYKEDLCPSLVQKSPFKSTSCFIDAASLVDEEDDTIKIQSDINQLPEKNKSDIFPAPSQPVPCSSVKLDISPNDWSESNDIEDSLEQADNKDTDSIQKDLSPTIFEMTPITEDSLSTNVFENAAQTEQNNQKAAEINERSNYTLEKEASLSTSAVFMYSTPHNSIMSLKASALKQFESEESESDTTIVGHTNAKGLKIYDESSPTMSAGASIDAHLPQVGTGSSLIQRKTDNISIISTMYASQAEDHRKSPKMSCASAWVVDMSSSPKLDGEKGASSTTKISCKKPGDKTCETLKNELKYISNIENCSKSRSSIDSDSSERSSHKFYIDLSSLPDPSPPKRDNDLDSISERKNIFSMYIDLGEKSTLKEMPSRLSSSFNTKKNNNAEIKNTSKSYKTTKITAIECNPTSINKVNDASNCTSTFEKYESLCNDPNISISEIIGLPEKQSIKLDKKDTSDVEMMKKDNQFRNIGVEKSSQWNKTTVIKEESINKQSVDLFVKLSDLDKPSQKTDTSILIHEEKVLDVRMTRSIPDNNWVDRNHTGASRSIEVISSFHSENALSLNRLFPHLKNEFSRSMPGSLSSRTRSPLRLGVSSSPGDIDEQASDMSEISSVQSSICRSIVENSTTEETSQTSSLIGNCQSRLGQDLLRMFLEEIAPDVIVEVSGRRIKAHKCILSSRCQYFAGILSGGWVESAGNVIVLPPFSFNVVHFALCHIYSGVSTIPDSISIVELATIADMLGLEGLKEAIMFTLKAKYCHHFHRPCSVCTAGVLECFPLSSVYGLDDLYRKCLRWITKYFSKVWPTKAFATLPKELLDKCYQQHIVNLTTENLVETVFGCGITVASLQNSRWAESVARMCRRLVNAAAHFAAPRLVAVLRAIACVPPDAPHPATQALDDCLAAAIEWAPPDEGCRAYAFLSGLVKEMRSQYYSKPDLITNGNQNTKVPNQNNFLMAHASSWRLQCEAALVRAAPRTVGTQAFKDLPSDLRKRLRELGCIMYGVQAIPMTPSLLQDRKTRGTYHNKTNKAPNSSATRSLDIDHVRASFVPYASKPTTQLGSVDILKSNNDLREIRKSGRTNPPKVRTTKAQEERAKFNLSKTNQSQDRTNNKISGTRIHSFENTKPRYLEPRMSKERDNKLPVIKKFVPKMVSSSESSRNSSPIQARNLRTSRMKSRTACEVKGQAISQDSLATSSRPRTAEPSTDSLSESQTSNKYATYTKTKHTTKGSIESIKSSKHQNTSIFNKAKTKIPVYYNQSGKSCNTDIKHANEAQKRFTNSGKINTTSAAAISVNTGTRKKTTNERKTPGSLMNATKSSSAKIVPKIIKDSPTSRVSTKHPKGVTKHISRQEDHEHIPDIPLMERSGTFLKDEPTFGDKTTNIDIDQ